MSALASRQRELSATISLLPPLLRAQDGALGELNASFTPTRTFANELLPGVRETASTLSVALPWLAQAHLLVSPTRLGGLLADLTPAVSDTSRTLASATPLLGGLDQLNRCLLRDLIPTGNEVISDPPLGTGSSVYQELYQSAVGLAGVTQGFDGNGRYLRVQTGGGTVATVSSSLPGEGALHGNALLPPLGTRPAWPGGRPPYRRTVACYSNAAPSLNAAQTGAAP
jgi:hypothetical protein